MPHSGWNWMAFITGPFWYLSNGLFKKGLLLLSLVVITLGFGIPFICVYCGVKGTSDLYEKMLAEKGQFDLKDI